MWPGPGLVVMALAFISVARRGISQNIPNQGNKLGKVGDENAGSLARVNPWLSACDLAQPNTAPDLQVDFYFFVENLMKSFISAPKII